jgi:hypothetical protein
MNCRLVIILCALVLVFFAPDGYSQAKAQHVFPLIADGSFPDGTSYRSTLMVQSLGMASGVTADCSVQLHGLTVVFESSMASTLNFSLGSNGWFQTRTTGTQPFRSGNATLTCTQPVYANVLYSLYSGSTRISEATVFSADFASSYRVIADQREGARVGIAVVSPASSTLTYTIVFRDEQGVPGATRGLMVPPMGTRTIFVDELLPSSSGQITEIEIRFSGIPVSAIALKFTGPVFTTIPAKPPF